MMMAIIHTFLMVLILDYLIHSEAVEARGQKYLDQEKKRDLLCGQQPRWHIPS
jgi:hypothetical protein